jgi:hypothetical protein
VYSESENEDDDQNNKEEDDEKSDEESSIIEVDIDDKDKGDKEEFPKSFIFSCIGIGLTNIARKTE